MKRNSSYRPEDVLGHILTEIEILLVIRKRVSEKQFYKDEVLKRTSVRCFEIIGEASKKLPKELKDENKEINWRDMAGMRDIMIHDYFHVDYEIVWKTMSENIPEFKKQIKKLKKKLKHD